MANPKHLSDLQRGVHEWNSWKGSEKIQPDLSGADLQGLDLLGANFFSTDLRKADLRGAQLTGARFDLANLREADCSGASLDYASFIQTDAKGLNLRGAGLIDAQFSAAKLSKASFAEATLYNTLFHASALDGACFTEAICADTIFARTDLSQVVGLDEIKHNGPSAIDVDTIYRSRGKIPETFLRGCGLPQDFITYAISLAGHPFEFYSCFISYSSKDQEFAERIYNDLQTKGVRCWLATEDLKIGDKFRIRIDESIRLHDKLLLVLSEHSVSSDWVEKEVETAMERERKEKRTVLFPIRLDDVVMDIPNGWPADIRRTRHIGDFRKWKNHDDYQKAFDRLLRDLKTDASTGGVA